MLLGMPRWFLSYNSQDLVLMQRLEAALSRRDAEAKFFFAPKSLQVGGFWLPQLADEIGQATAFVLLVGEKGVGPWQVIEYYEALDRRVKQHDFPIVLVLIDGQSAPGLPFVRQLHWIVSADPTSEKSVSQIMDAAAGVGRPPGELWRHAAPYRGLAAMTEADTDFFFGRGEKTIEVLEALARTPEKLHVLLGDSGVGKSSLAQAGVLAALLRQSWPEAAKTPGSWPQGLSESRHWCALTLMPGTEPVRALVEPFIRTWQFDSTDPRRETRLIEWTESLTQGRGTLRGLLDATTERLQELGQLKSPVFLLYVDQGEELYVRAEPNQRRRFSQILAKGLADPRLRALLSLRADFIGNLLKDDPLQDVSRKIEVPPLREAQLREVVSRPAALLSARFETDSLAADIAKRTASESTSDAAALPLLSYLLDDMWQRMIERGDGVIRLPAQSIELGRVLVERADAFLARNPNAEDKLRRIFTLSLATVREDGEPTRRRAVRSEFTDDEWLLVSQLADHPNRLLITVAPENGETFAEVAHEAIFRRWDRLREWIAGEREFLAWRSGLEAARRSWQAMPTAMRQEALLMGAALTQAQSWFAKRGKDLTPPDRQFIALSIRRKRAARARGRGVQALVYVLLVGIIAGLVAWINQSFVKDQWRWYTVTRQYMQTQMRPFVLPPAKEAALKAGDTFKECAANCPAMTVIPAGSFIMGSAVGEKGHRANEEPQHAVTIVKPFAVSTYDVTFAEWDACAAYGDCDPAIPDGGFGRDLQPVINVPFSQAQKYVSWLSKMTGKAYRLLTEAEYEYVTRAGTQTTYPWGDAIGTNHADCNGCGSQWDEAQPAPVGKFEQNRFGLSDMVGDVWEWLEDCAHKNFVGAPTDGSAWLDGDCKSRVARGGSWRNIPETLRSAYRSQTISTGRDDNLGFRVARSLAP